MKTFNEFIIEANDAADAKRSAAADRIEQRRQIAKDKSKTAAKDFVSKSKDKMQQQRAKSAEIKSKYDAEVEAHKEREKQKPRFRLF
jgi:hypothetical protein